MIPFSFGAVEEALLFMQDMEENASTPGWQLGRSQEEDARSRLRPSKKRRKKQCQKKWRQYIHISQTVQKYSMHVV